MALISPPGYLQAGTYDAVKDRQYINTTRFYKSTLDNARARSGLLPDRVDWSAPISFTGFNVSVGPFRAVGSNVFATGGGDYMVVSPNTETRTLAGSSTTTNRIDVIGYQIRDAFYSGAANDVDVIVVPGTPSAGTPAVPTLPSGFDALYRLAVNANSTVPVVTDVRQRTAPLGTPIPIFPNQVAQSGSYFGEVQLLPSSGAMPARQRVWGEDAAWHGVSSFVLDFGGYVLNSQTADRMIASLSVADPGYAYKLTFTGNVWAGIDTQSGWQFSVRVGGSAGTLLGSPGAYEVRDPGGVYNGTNSIPVGGSSGIATGALALQLWAQRKFGATTQGLAVDPGTQLAALVVPA